MSSIGVVRIAGPGDAVAIAALHAASWRAAYRGLLSDHYLDAEIEGERAALWSARLNSSVENQYVILAEQGGRLGGFACAYLGNDLQWGALLDNLHVSPALQRRGLGRRLMRSVASRCAAAGEARLYLWVLQANAAAHRFYECLGARREGEDLWIPPAGGALPRYRYAWRDVGVILNAR